MNIQFINVYETYSMKYSVWTDKEECVACFAKKEDAERYIKQGEIVKSLLKSIRELAEQLTLAGINKDFNVMKTEGFKAGLTQEEIFG